MSEPDASKGGGQDGPAEQPPSLLLPKTPFNAAQANGSIQLGNAITVLVCGLGIGILVGLSVAPVVGSVVSVLVALMAGLLTVARHFHLRLPPQAGDATGKLREFSFSMDTPVQLEVAFLVFGLVVGALGGMYIRNNDLLGPRASVDGPERRDDRPKMLLAGNRQDTEAAVPGAAAGISGLGGMATGSQSILFASANFDGCAAGAGKMTETQLEIELSLAQPRLRAFIASRKVRLSRDQLVVLLETFVCPASPLSGAELTELGRDKNSPSGHHHPLVAQLGRRLDDHQLILAIARDVLGPRK